METIDIILDPAIFCIISYLHIACSKCDCGIENYAIYRSERAEMSDAILAIVRWRNFDKYPSQVVVIQQI